MADEPQHAHEHQHAAHEHAQPEAPDPVAGSFTPRPTAGLLAMELEGELLLLDPRTNRLHVLDRLGTAIWNVLDGEVTVDELARDLAEVFDTPADTVRADLGQLVDALRAAALLDDVQPPAYLLVGAGVSESTENEGLWRPSYLADPPAP